MTTIPMRWRDDALELIDQRLLPVEQRWVRCTDAATTADAIRDMVVRGAPAIGITAAYGLALEALIGGDVQVGAERLLASRPTAVNLAWAIRRMRAAPQAEWLELAHALHREDVAINQRMGEHGAALLPDGARVYSHCNAGALATGGWGTSLGVVRSAHAKGRLERVWVGETRPYLQGARLTAWELDQDGIPCVLVCDSVAATLFAAGRVDAVLVGCDRVAANGDVANKVGTLGLAVLAKHYGVPFYVAMPTSTLDRDCPNGAAIPIEQRPAAEVRGFGGLEWAADVPVFNPSFDVTPAALVSAWVTEDGLWSPS